MSKKMYKKMSKKCHKNFVKNDQKNVPNNVQNKNYISLLRILYFLNKNTILYRMVYKKNIFDDGT